MKIIGRKLFCLITMTLLVIIGSNTQLHSQNGVQMSLTGVVQNIDNKSPVSGVKVTLFKLNDQGIKGIFSAVSDSKGFYKIRLLEAGKYRFAVDMPGIGIIQISMSASNGVSTQWYYEFEVMEGKNSRLNIFTGQNPYAYIERNDNAALNEMNFIMLYDIPASRQNKTKKSPEDMGVRDNAKRTADRDMKGDTLAILPPNIGGEINYGSLILRPVIETITSDTIYTEDEETGEKRKCNGLSTFILTIKKATWCIDGICNYELKAEMKRYLTIHTMQWYADNHPENSHQLNSCHRDCTIVHETVHHQDFIDLTYPEWQKFLAELNRSTIKCCDGCQDVIGAKFDEMWDRVKAAAGEKHAYHKSDACRKKCK
ncbi:MAG: carboxypeptidase regulatory-like domain-containing protein [bacterium]|nr:carboxypeptidase regulatory-like domain-containing protein [bacterium]